jgi:hypothetical protein
MFNLFEFSCLNMLNDNDILNVIQHLPSKIIDIIEAYNIDVKKYISYQSGLIQMEPLFKAYDLTEVDRKALIEYAVLRNDLLKKKEEEYLDILRKDIDAGDYTFIEIYQMMKIRVDMRKASEKEQNLLNLYNIKYKPETVAK